MPYVLKKKGTHLEDSIRNRLGYWRRVKNMMEMHEIKEKSILFRKKVMDDRNKMNYQNEYDRLRGNLAHNVVPIQTQETMRKRIDELARLGATALPN